MVETVNPYSASIARVEDVEAAGEAETIRRAHIQHEASIRSVGILYYVVGGACVIGAAAGFLFLEGRLLTVLRFGVLGAVYLPVGWAIRALKRWGRNACAVLSVLGLLAFPVGTLINGYILWLIFSQKGKTVFSPQYQDVIAATPHVKYKTSILSWIVLVLALIVVLWIAKMTIAQLAHY